MNDEYNYDYELPNELDADYRNQILKMIRARQQILKSDPATLLDSDRYINLRTKEHNNVSSDPEVAVLNNSVCPSDPVLPESQRQKPQASLLVATADEPKLSMREEIAGIEIQNKKYDKKNSLCFMLTIQHQSGEAFSYTAYLQNRKCNKNFKKGMDADNVFEQELYQFCVENKAWYLGRVTERSYGGERIDGYVMLHNPETNLAILCFDDGSDPIQIPLDNKELTEKQKPYYLSAGTWGKQIKFTKPGSRRPGECRTKPPIQ